jgi:undecaprenyl-diphosphatase
MNGIRSSEAPGIATSERPDAQPPAPPRMPALGGLVLLMVAIAALAGYAFASRSPELSTGAAILLGLVEGLTEWLPISSTGHLTVTQELLGIDGDAANSYAIAIQAGAILAVLLLYRARFAAMLRGIVGQDPAGRRTLVAVIVACLPAVIVGLALEDVIKDRLFGPWPVVAAWFIGGLAILFVARRRRDVAPTSGAPLATLDWRGALLIGLAQTLALWPGVSRSLVTILAATAIGLAVPAAVEFSFLLGFVILGGATLYETLSSGSEMLAAYGLATPLLGLAVAFGSAVAAMRWMIGYLNRHGLGVFGWYRIAIAAVVAGLLLTGVI